MGSSGQGTVIIALIWGISVILMLLPNTQYSCILFDELKVFEVCKRVLVVMRLGAVFNKGHQSTQHRVFY